MTLATKGISAWRLLLACRAQALGFASYAAICVEYNHDRTLPNLPERADILRENQECDRTKMRTRLQRPPRLCVRSSSSCYNVLQLRAWSGSPRRSGRMQGPLGCLLEHSKLNSNQFLRYNCENSPWFIRIPASLPLVLGEAGPVWEERLFAQVCSCTVGKR